MLNILDWIIIIFILLPVWRGYRRGLIRELFGFLGMIVAFIAAARFAGNMSIFIKDVAFGVAIPAWASMLIVFVVTIIIIEIAINLLKKVIEKILFKGFNKAGGCLVGFLKGIFFITVIIMGLSAWSITERYVSKSKLAKPCMVIARGLSVIIPDKLKETLHINKKTEAIENNNQV